MPADPAARAAANPPPRAAATSPHLHLRTLDRGDGFLGLKPCGPVPRGLRAPLFGARGPTLTVAWLDWPHGQPPYHQADEAEDKLRHHGLHPLPADALQWRGEPTLATAPGGLWSLVREADFAPFWDQVLPLLRQQGWLVHLAPGFAHAAATVDGWQLRVEPLTPPAGLASWLVSLGVDINGETLDLVPMMARLLAQDGRWRQVEGINSIDDESLVRLRAPGGRLIDAPAAPLKAIARSLVDLITQPRRTPGPLTLQGWDAQRLQALRRELAATQASHASALRDWALQGDAGLALLADRLQHVGPLAPATAPEGLGITLRPYQLLGLAWLQALRAQALAGILADDMGLGKTAQALAHVLLERQAGRLDRPALVVAPASLLANWQAEAARITPTLRVLVLQGPRRASEMARIPQHDLVITSYPLLWRDAMALQRQPWHLVVLDEAQMVKNAGSRTAAAARRLNACHRLSLTGTPLENHLGELWAQFHFLLPGFLGDARSFQRQWRTPIEKNGETQRAALLAARVRPFILRRRKDQVATELPPLTDQLVRLRLEGPQRALYESVRLACDAKVRALMHDTHRGSQQIAVLDALLKLRQVCCDARLVKGAAAGGAPGSAAVTVSGSADSASMLPPDGHSAKLDWLRASLPQMSAAGRRVIVFSQFTEWLRLLMPELDALRLPWLALTGDTPTARRAALVAQFQTGTVPVLLASLKAGGTGLNLTAADCVLHLDPWWNPAVTDQASARAHRIGQTRPVWVLRLVAEGSIEERLLALQQRKAGLARALLGDVATAAVATAAGQAPPAAGPASNSGEAGDNADFSTTLPHFSPDDLAGLLQPLPPA